MNDFLQASRKNPARCFYFGSGASLSVYASWQTDFSSTSPNQGGKNPFISQGHVVARGSLPFGYFPLSLSCAAALAMDKEPASRVRARFRRVAADCLFS